MRTLLLATALAVVMTVAAACDKGGGGEPTEGSLKETAQAAGDAIVSGNAPEAYEYMHPDYQEKCPQEDFLGLVLFSLAFLQGDGEELEFEVLEATVEGDRGTVRSEITRDGESLGTEPNEGDYWVFEDGEWLLMTDDEAPCEGLGTDDDSDEPDVEPGEITVEKQGYTYDAESGSISYGIVIKNQSTDVAAEQVTVQVAFYDANGGVLDTSSDSVSNLLPGQSAGIGGAAQVSAAPAEMRVQTDSGDWAAWDREVEGMTFSNVQIIKDEFGDKVTGEVTNPFDVELDGVMLHAIYLDAAGEIVGGDYTFHDFIPANGTSPFEIGSFTDLPNVASVEVYGQPGFVDLDELE